MLCYMNSGNNEIKSRKEYRYSDKGKNTEKTKKEKTTTKGPAKRKAKRKEGAVGRTTLPD